MQVLLALYTGDIRGRMISVLNQTEKQLLEIITSNPGITVRKITELLKTEGKHVPVRNYLDLCIKRLREQELIYSVQDFRNVYCSRAKKHFACGTGDS